MTTLFVIFLAIFIHYALLESLNFFLIGPKAPRKLEKEIISSLEEENISYSIERECFYLNNKDEEHVQIILKSPSLLHTTKWVVMVGDHKWKYPIYRLSRTRQAHKELNRRLTPNEETDN
jgi:hypothetical protein